MTQYVYISHSGVKGMRWGVRRYQNEDGTLTEEGKVHYKKILDNKDKNYDAFGKVAVGSSYAIPISIGATAIGAILGGPAGAALITVGAGSFMAEKIGIATGIGGIAITKVLSNNADKKLNDELNHSSFKYYAKIPLNGGKSYRYFYSKDEYQAYLSGKNNATIENQASSLKKTDKSTELTGYVSNNKNVKKVAQEENKISAISGLIFDTSKLFKHASGNLIDYIAGDKFTDLRKVPREHNKELSPETAIEDMKLINPKYDSADMDYSQNCSFCTAAYDLRRRGYDVVADNIDYYVATTIAEQLQWYDNAVAKDLTELVHESSIDVLESEKRADSLYDNSINKYGVQYPQAACSAASLIEQGLSSQGTGARGFIDLAWAGGGGHAIAYEVFDHLGTPEVKFYDTQVCKEIDIVEYIAYADSFTYIRTDNVKVNDNVLKTCVKKK